MTPVLNPPYCDRRLLTSGIASCHGAELTLVLGEGEDLLRTAFVVVGRVCGGRIDRRLYLEPR